MCRQYACCQVSTVDTVPHVARKIDPDDLIDSEGVAALLGLSSRTSVATYRKRHDDFPAPIVDMGRGRCLLWLKPEVERWAAEQGRKP
jgi:predicted DNA-binding transcriptional regulator AlpA